MSAVHISASLSYRVYPEVCARCLDAALDDRLHAQSSVAAEGILVGGQRKYQRPSQRGAPSKFGGAPIKIQNFGAHTNDYTVDSILHAPLPKREAPLVGNLGS